MQNKALLLILSLMVILSCKSNPSNPSVQTPTAVVKGQVFLASAYYDTPHGQNPSKGPFNGIQISLDGTSFNAITNDSGVYEIRNVPQGVYNVRFSKPGYGEVRWFSVEIEGGGNAPVYLYRQDRPGYEVSPVLFKQSSLVMKLESAYLKDSMTTSYGIAHMWLTGHYSSNAELASRIAIYASHNSTVSAQAGHYDFLDTWGFGGGLMYDTTHRSFKLPVDLTGFQNYGFKSGDSVYFALYGVPYEGAYPYWDYYDPEFHQYVLSSVNPTPSPVFGLKIP